MADAPSTSGATGEKKVVRKKVVRKVVKKKVRDIPSPGEPRRHPAGGPGCLTRRDTWHSRRIRIIMGHGIRIRPRGTTSRPPGRVCSISMESPPIRPVPSARGATQGRFLRSPAPDTGEVRGGTGKRAAPGPVARHRPVLRGPFPAPHSPPPTLLRTRAGGPRAGRHRPYPAPPAQVDGETAASAPAAAPQAAAQPGEAGPSTAAGSDDEGPRAGWAPKAPRKPSRKVGDFEEYQQLDYVRTMTARNTWYYRDRLSVPRGPCSMPVLREAWCNGVIDENTLVW